MFGSVSEHIYVLHHVPPLVTYACPLPCIHIYVFYLCMQAYENCVMLSQAGDILCHTDRQVILGCLA